jgi:hypothetical protein
MKKSHRKDVIIARIIFACMVLILIVVIVVGVRAVLNYRADRSQKQEPDVVTTETTQPGAESESGAEPEQPADDNDQWMIDDTETGNPDDADQTGENEETEGTGEEEGTGDSDQVLLKAMYSVNVRSGAGKDFAKVGGVEEGAVIVLLEDEGNGWGYIQKGDLTGYVYLEYFQTVDSAEE